MYILPFQNWHADLDAFDLTNLNFTWEMESFEIDKLVLRLKFINPSQISPKKSFDDLAIQFEGYFASIKGIPLSDKFLRAPVKR